MPDEITYHHLGPNDGPLIEDSDVFDNSVDPVQLAAFLVDPGHEMVVALAGSKVIGMASGTVLLHPDKPPAFFVAEVGVDEDMRKLGIGSALVERLLNVARARGCQGIWLATEADNIAARALYRTVGARETGGIVVYDWDGAMD